MEFEEASSSGQIQSAVHPEHPGCPDNLNCLPDSEVKPRDTFATIIRCAIMGAPHKRMTLAAIYTAIEAKYPYYRDAGPGWKNTVRHVLSTSQQFEKSRRPITEPGKGGYWSVNLTVTPKGENPRQRKSAPLKQLARPDPIPSPGWMINPRPTSTDLAYVRTLQSLSEPQDESHYITQEQVALAAHLAHLPHPTQYHLSAHAGPYAQNPAIQQLTPMMYAYNNAGDRPGWLNEVSWSVTPLGHVASGAQT